MSRSPQASHVCLWIRLWANSSHSRRNHSGRCTGAAIPIHCTRTTQAGAVSCTPRPTPPTALTRRCPHHAQALILLLKSLHSFLFRNRAWGGTTPHPRPGPEQTRLSLTPISFQDGVRRSTVVVRLPFRSSERITGTGVHRREHRTSQGEAAEKSALLFEVTKGRNERGDDHSRLDRLEVSLGAR
jgi:hypothetical protein